MTQGKPPLSQHELTQTIATLKSKRGQAERRGLYRLVDKYDEKLAELEAQRL